MDLIALLLIWTIGSVVVGLIARQRGKSGLRFILVSLLLSPLVGLVLALLVKSAEGAKPGDAQSNKPEDMVATFQNADTGVLTPEEAESMRLWAEQERQSTTEDMTASQNAATKVLTPEEMDAIHRAAEKK